MTHDRVPLWFQQGLVTSVSVVLGLGGVGLLAADTGHYHFVPVLVVGAVVAAVLAKLAWPRLRRVPGVTPDVDRSARLPAGLAVVLAAVAAGINGAHGTVHIATGRDPGVYTTAALWIAKHGNLQIPGWPAFAADFPVSQRSPGITPGGGGHSEFIFAHLLPVLMAEAHGLGGDALIRFVPAVLAALGLCAVYAVGCRLTGRPWIVLACLIALAVSMPEVRVARDALSESSAQLLLWGGIALLLMAFDRGRVGPSVTAGLALGATMWARIDAVIYIIPLPIVAAIAWLVSARGRERVGRVRVIAGCGVAAVVAMGLGLLDVYTASGTYPQDLHAQVHQLYEAMTGTVVVGILLVVIVPRAKPVVTRLRDNRTSIATGLGVLVAFVLVLAWFVRPHFISHAPKEVAQVAGLQKREHLAIDGKRDYAESTMVWLSWYVGPILLALGIAGVVPAVRRLIAGHAPMALVLSTAGLGTALYLKNPDIIPDQIWASRRFVTAALPLVALLAAFVLAIGFDRLPADWHRGPRAAVLVVVAVLGLGAFPAAATRPVVGFEVQTGFTTAIAKTCTALGPNAVALVVKTDANALTAIGALRSVCDVPVGEVLKPFTAAQVTSLAADWRARGRTLYLVASSAAVAQQAVGTTAGLKPVADAASPRELPLTIGSLPQHYETLRLTLMVQQLQ